MIEYYADSDREMYERCAMLNKILKKKYPSEVVE